jgi:hypothetical protein
MQWWKHPGFITAIVGGLALLALYLVATSASPPLSKGIALTVPPGAHAVFQEYLTSDGTLCLLGSGGENGAVTGVAGKQTPVTAPPLP